MRRSLGAAIVALLFIAATPAAAHKLHVFAAVDGTVIAGSLYFNGNSPARDVPIRVLGPDGRLEEKTTSDTAGHFRVAIAGPFDHRIVADTVDGHHAEFVVRSDELPLAAAAAPLTAKATTVAAGLPRASPPLPLPTEQLEQLIEQAVSRQLAPLREQLDAFEERVLWRDVLGGIGYIVGLFGLAAWLMARHRRLHRRSPQD